MIYAYADLDDAKAHHPTLDAQVLALPVPIMHILFQLIALQSVESMLFFDQPGDRQAAVEIHRQELQNLVTTQLQRYQRQSRQHPRPPADIA